ncbi:hypothetical protein CL176_06460 [Suicoccus acidiformans]|uniref:ABC transporter substrate-binding protein n=1 Tax=Suicoccus acidiformans TaxID=2036206 RepID=A0A347WKR2_9LACT|nr:extracellular solute-binding protein [Suicoccus acidiformans]AXY25669.1 hypothetical protein CL176_06460 [Suicoccus acidiformans]
MQKLTRKILTGVLSLMTLGFTLAPAQAPAVSAEDVPTVTIWGSGGQEVRDALQAVADAHNADPEYGAKAQVEIQFVVSGTNEQSLNDRLAAAYEAGETETDFDLIAIDDSAIGAIVAQTDENFFEPIDTNQIPNYENVVYKDNIVGDTFIPYRGTAVYLAYNEDVVPEPPKTDEELYQWIKDNPGRFTYCDPSTGNSGFAFVANAIYNQLPEEAATSGDAKWVEEHQEEWDNGIALLQELHPHMYQTAGSVQYPHKNAGSLDLLTTQQVDMIPAFANMVLDQRSMGVLPENIKLTQIEPSFLGGLAGFLMPTIGSDKEAAHSVIDYFLSYEAQAMSWNEMFATPVVDSAQLEGLENQEWLEETNLDELRYFNIGDNRTVLQTRWTEEVSNLD